MLGLNLNKPISCGFSSFRYFEPKEHHVTRYCSCDILLLVFEGVLRFSENDRAYEIGAGEYFIQKDNCYQAGVVPSDSPKYLYVHFQGEWGDDLNCLPRRGHFDIESFMPLLEEMDKRSHGDYTLVEQTGTFYEILSRLKAGGKPVTTAGQIATFLEKHYGEKITLEMLTEQFHFSKNHVINLFRTAYGVTPFAYLNRLRIDQSARLLEVSDQPVESICRACGIDDYPYFYKLFKRVYGLSPTAYRKHKRLSSDLIFSPETSSNRRIDRHAKMRYS